MKRKWLRQIRRLLENRAVVLMYHRIADVPIDPFELAVSPANFEAQLQVLKKDFKVIPVNELVNRLHNKSISSNCVCITFDDGYYDNYFAAKPLLEKYGCPATFYIATEYIGKAQQFWWDELQHVLLNTPKLPPELSLNVNGNFIEFHLENDGVLTKEQWQKQKAWLFSEQPVTQRCELFVAIWTQLKPLPHIEQQRLLKQIKCWAGLSEPFGMEDFPMSSQQLQTIANDSLFEIGVHTVTHPSLSLQTNEMQRNEIAECKQYLESRYSKRMHTISYPYGDFNATTLDIVKEQKLYGAFTTDERVITKRTDPACAGRFQVKNWNGSDFKKQLEHWFKHY